MLSLLDTDSVANANTMSEADNVMNKSFFTEELDRFVKEGKDFYHPFVNCDKFSRQKV